MTQNLQFSAQTELRKLVDKVERLNDERAALAGDIKEVLDEAKSQGFDVKALRRLIQLRKLPAAERIEQEAVLESYIAAVGWASTPLAKAAERPALTVV